MNPEQLRYEMAKKGISVSQLCAGIGMGRTTFYRKCQGFTEFTRNEIQKIVDFLGLDSPMGIFFASNVPH